MDRLDVRTSRMQPVLAWTLGLIMVPLALGAMFTGLSGGVSPVPSALG